MQKPNYCFHGEDPRECRKCRYVNLDWWYKLDEPAKENWLMLAVAVILLVCVYGWIWVQ